MIRFANCPEWFKTLIELQDAAWDEIPPQEESLRRPWNSNMINPQRPPHVFRGEPAAFGPIESSLCREFRKYVDQRNNEEREVFLDSLQLYLLEEVAAVLPDVDENHIGDLRDRKELLRSSTARRLLYRLRHRGFPTNIVDFTGNLTVALYFACQEGHDDEDGRVLICARQPGHLLQPDISDLRVVVQNSRFYWFTQGVLSVEGKEWARVFPIPRQHKPKLRVYLRNVHNMVHATLFPDLEGVMEWMQNVRSGPVVGQDSELETDPYEEWQKLAAARAAERPRLFPSAEQTEDPPMDDTDA